MWTVRFSIWCHLVAPLLRLINKSSDWIKVPVSISTFFSPSFSFSLIILKKTIINNSNKYISKGWYYKFVTKDERISLVVIIGAFFAEDTDHVSSHVNLDNFQVLFPSFLLFLLFFFFFFFFSSFSFFFFFLFSFLFSDAFWKGRRSRFHYGLPEGFFQFQVSFFFSFFHFIIFIFKLNFLWKK